MKSSVLSVGEVASRFGVATHVLRHWEDQGLLDPARDPAGRRQYRRDDVVRVAAIQANKQAGMSLEQIAVLFDSGAPGRHALLEDHLGDLDRRIEALRASRAMAEHALRCEAHDITRCPRFRATLADTLGEPAPDTVDGE